MADGTKIEWTDATVNAINGCSVISPGCTNCYAMRLAGTRLKHHPSRAGLTVDSKAGPVWNGQVRPNEEQMLQPLRWARPRRIFWNAHGDMFHADVPTAWIDRCFAVMALTPQHIHQVLTKRADRMHEYFSDPSWASRISSVVNAWPSDKIGRGNEFTADFNLCFGNFLPNVWLGVSAEDQKRFEERTDLLMLTPAAVRWASVEPMLGAIVGTAPADSTFRMLSTWYGPDGFDETGSQPERDRMSGYFPRLDWLVCGGESGPGARPMHPSWVRNLRDQCAEAGTAFFFKQWGEWAPVCAMDDALIDNCYHPAPERHPDASRRCKVEQHILHEDGSRHHFLEPRAFWQGTGAMTMMKVGKAKAGRLLDGVQHDGMPS